VLVPEVFNGHGRTWDSERPGSIGPEVCNPCSKLSLAGSGCAYNDVAAEDVAAKYQIVRRSPDSVE
jgi:hypothetical protein